MSGGFRVGASASVPASVRKTIQNIKEIAGNHSEDDVYAMLKECNMDPNETAQKLLLQDTFHEVKRKRDKKKENVNKEHGDHRWRAGTQGRGGRVVRGGLSSRYASHDVAIGQNFSASKENGITQAMEKGDPLTSLSCTLHTSESHLKSSGPSAISKLPNGSENLLSETSSYDEAAPKHGMMGIITIEGQSDGSKLGIQELLASELERHSASTVSTRSGHDPIKNLSSQTQQSLSAVYSSSPHHVLHPLHGSRVQGAVSATKREVGSHQINHETAAVGPSLVKLIAQNLPDEMHNDKLDSTDGTESGEWSRMSEVASLGTGNSSRHGAEASKAQGVEISLLQEAQPGASSSQSGLILNRPSSNYGSGLLPPAGCQKAVGLSKEWKPKHTIPSPAQLSGIQGSSTSGEVRIEINAEALISQSTMSEDSTPEVQKKLEEFHFSDGQHVIIPNHLQVSESERCTLTFGSFGANLELSGVSSELDSGKEATSLSESSKEVEESVEGPLGSLTKEIPSNEEECLDTPDPALDGTASLRSSDFTVTQNPPKGSTPDPPKIDAGLATGGCSIALNYSTFGLIPPIPGNQFPPLESSEPHSGSNISPLPGFVVQQPFDPSTSYYTPLYRPSTDGDARFTQLILPGSGAKYNGNIAVLPAQSAPSVQENGNSLVLSSTAASPIGSQTTGVVQSPIPVNQQPLPVFRQPTGMHLSHYPPNYLPYNQYFPPLYVPPPSIHHFLSNTAFAQQPPAGLVYPPPAGAPAAPVKYSLSQYKPGTNTGSATNIAISTGYATYTTAPAGFGLNTVSTGNSTTNEDGGGSQFKENNVYIAGQQGEGSGVWVPTPGRDVASLPASLFYNLPPQGQLTFGPSQAGHGAFAGIFHPAQPMAGANVHTLLQQSQTIGPTMEVVGPQPAVYQQPQRAQVNWASNY